MEIDRRNEPPKIDGIVGDENAVLLQTEGEHRVVALAAAADVGRVNGVEASGPDERQRHPWRQALLDEELHAARRHGRSPGRPTSGWARA